jgi:hypothetical protein
MQYLWVSAWLGASTTIVANSSWSIIHRQTVSAEIPIVWLQLVHRKEQDSSVATSNVRKSLDLSVDAWSVSRCIRASASSSSASPGNLRRNRPTDRPWATIGRPVSLWSSGSPIHGRAMRARGQSQHCFPSFWVCITNAAVGPLSHRTAGTRAHRHRNHG